MSRWLPAGGIFMAVLWIAVTGAAGGTVAGACAAAACFGGGFVVVAVRGDLSMLAVICCLLLRWWLLVLLVISLGLTAGGVRGYVLPNAQVADLMLAYPARGVRCTLVAFASVASHTKGGLLMPLAAPFA